MPPSVRFPIGTPAATTSTPGTMSAADKALLDALVLGIPSSAIQTITSGTTATIGAGIRLVLVDTSAGPFTLTRGALVVGHVCEIAKTSLDANTISVAPALTEVIMHAGLAASNATKVLAGSGLANRPTYKMTDTAAGAVFIA